MLFTGCGTSRDCELGYSYTVSESIDCDRIEYLNQQQQQGIYHIYSIACSSVSKNWIVSVYRYNLPRNDRQFLRSRGHFARTHASYNKSKYYLNTR